MYEKHTLLRLFKSSSFEGKTLGNMNKNKEIVIKYLGEGRHFKQREQEV